MKKLAALGVALLLAGCRGPDGLVTILDQRYKAELLGGSETGFAAPDGLTWHDGRLFIADEGGSALRQWQPGKSLQTLAQEQGIRSPEDLVRGSDGTIYFSDDDAGGVWRLDRTGILSHLGKELRSTEGLAMAPSGGLVVGDQARRLVAHIDPDSGSVTTLVGPELGISKPESMTFDDVGNLYIADNLDDVLYLLDSRGKLQRLIADRAGFSPESVHFSNGSLFITDSKHGTIYRYARADGLSAIAILAGDLRNVQGITTDPKGNLYVSVQTNLKAGRGHILRLSRAAPAKR